ncbi:hypothetical protein JCM8097_002142 [Rhodosporidiobolus ruineniae]
MPYDVDVSSSSDERQASSYRRTSRTSFSSDDGTDESDLEPPRKSAAPTHYHHLWLLSLAVLLVGLAVVVIVLVETKGDSAFISSASASTTTGSKSGPTSEKSASGTGTALPATATAAPSFFSSLASLYSVTPAPYSSLPMPTTTISASSAAQTYMSEKWNRLGGSGRVSFVEDPLAGEEKKEDEVVLQVSYPKGESGGSNGVGAMHFGVFGEGKQRAMLSYEVGFSENFDWAKGGKLPGLFGGTTDMCTGGKSSTACFSLRLMWQRNASAIIYVYAPQYEEQCDHAGVECYEGYLTEYARGTFTLTAGAYNTLTEVAILNSDPGEKGEANGILALYAGEQLAFRLDNVILRTNASVVFSTLLFSTFYGGCSGDCSPSEETYTYFRNFRVWEGDEASSLTGKVVEAAID